MDHGKNKHTAFVLGLFDTGLGVIRSLGRNGIPVTGVDFDLKMPGFKSRYCAPKLCPHPARDPEKMLEFMLTEGRKLNSPGILFPASDEMVLFVSRFRDALQPFFNLAMPSQDIVESIVNKKKQCELAEKVGIPYPWAFFPQNIKDIKNIRDQLEYPVLIKPIYSYQWHERFKGIKGFRISDPLELSLRFEEIMPAGIPVMVQSIIPGPNTNHFKVNVYINKRGELLAMFMLRKVRQYPIEFGVGTCVESLYYSELKELGLKFYEGIDYKGVGSIEFKKDERDGKLKMIELNPRYWQQNIQATVCGMNFPLVQYLDLTGQDPKPLTEFKTDVKWLDAIADFQSFLDYYRKGELSPWQWFRSLAHTKSFSSFAWDDLGPFLKNIEYGLKPIKAPLYLLKHRKIKKD